MHHVVGEWYFLIRGVGNRGIWIRELPEYLLHLLRRQIVSRENLGHPFALATAALRCVAGLAVAVARASKSPKYADGVKKSQYVVYGGVRIPSPCAAQFETG
jgi:hypothetical protein